MALKIDRDAAEEKLAADLALKRELVEALKQEHLCAVGKDPKRCDFCNLITRAEA